MIIIHPKKGVINGLLRLNLIVDERFYMWLVFLIEVSNIFCHPSQWTALSDLMGINDGIFSKNTPLDYPRFQ